MKMLKIVAVLLTSFVGCDGSNLVDFSDDTTITTIPWNLVKDTHAILYANRATNLQSVGDIPTTKIITTIQLKDNTLDAFPDFFNIRTTLKNIDLTNNLISDISPPSLLGDLEVLGSLYLRGNPLVSLPSVESLPPTLNGLYLQDTLLTSLPNFSNYRRTATGVFFVMVTNTPLRCDGRMLWTKFATTNAMFYSDPVCASPAEHANKPLSDVTNAELLKTDNVYFGRLMTTADFQAYPEVVDTINGTTVVACATKCVSLSACAVFATDGGNCVLTRYNEGTFGTKTDFEVYSRWYMLQ